MSRPLLLDLFCGAGGCSVGYHRAGFDVVGVDIEPQPHYPFRFVQGDALDLRTWLEAADPFPVIDAIHASPPCQAYIRSGMYDKSKHPDLLPDVRDLLEATGLPWVIENVPGAPMRADVKLCGCMFGLEVKRERWFETSWREFDIRQPCYHPDPVVGVYGNPRGGVQGETWGWGTFEDWKRAMGIDWMTADELRLAIPPAYTEHVGTQLLGVLASEQSAMVSRPLLDGLARPHLAHVKGHLGCGEVLAVDELLDTLTAHAEHAADLCRPD